VTTGAKTKVPKVRTPKRGEFLLEVRCEEIPANALDPARKQLAEGFHRALVEAGYEGFEARAFSTVRRLIVSVTGLDEQQRDREEEAVGPSVKVAYTTDGSPTQAAVGFARSLGVAVEELRVLKGPKGEVIAGTRLLRGRPTPEVLADVAPAVVGTLHFPKTMRWGAGAHSFVRPVHGVVALWGVGSLSAVVPVELFGVAAGSTTVGHRVIAPAPIELVGCEGFVEYGSRLGAAGVIVDPAERHARLTKAATRLAAEVGCEVRHDAELEAEHVELVEYPGVVRGEIAERFLELPEEVLITTLRHHQKCLVLVRAGRVAPHFLAVADRTDDPEGLVRRGNEWVAGARLTDAAFFFTQDRREPLAARSARLDRIAFHSRLGTYADKTRGVAALAAALAGEAAAAIDAAKLARAASLLKADLGTAMVGEFPELQGVIGGIYARLDGEPAEVWQAIADQYTPAGLDGALPRGPLGAVLGVADRLDTLAGFFQVGETPSGSKDPFALRRAALAVVRVCAEAPLRIDLQAALARALEGRTPQAAKKGKGDGPGALRDFLLERERFYLTSAAGVAPEAADAALAARWGVVPDDVARARAVEAIRREAVFGQLAIAFKRVRNMVAKGGAGTADEKRMTEPAERLLLEALAGVEREAGKALGGGDHAAALRALAKLADPLERFFTDVLVLCDDEALRAARLALLARVERLFLQVADLSKLSA
jgi:glycyl-tRNA synthetase beta chain